MYPQPQRQNTAASAEKTRSQKIATKTCLITGFDGFGENRVNTSEQLVNVFPEQTRLRRGTLRLQREVLSTCCSNSWKKLHRLLEKSSPDVVVLLGLAQKRHRLSLERFALNVRDYRIPDNSGHVYKGTSIRRGGAEAYRSDLPLDKLQSLLLKRGYPCEISNSAGSFVCNDLYYHALEYQRSSRNSPVILFVHLPPPSKFAATLREEFGIDLGRDRSEQLVYMMNGVLTLAKFCAEL